MVKEKAGAPYWCTPGKIATERRKSTQLEKKRKKAKKENDVLNTATTQPSKAQPFVNPQSACPLYNLPQEIRDAIFELALTSYEDKSRPYDPKSTDYKHYHDYFRIRPGFFQHRWTDTELLRTCRLIYGETRLMPVAINSHVLHYHPSHVRSFSLATIATNYFRNMTDEQLAAVRHIQIFADHKRLNSMDPGTYRSHTAFAELGYLRDGSGPGRLKACPRRRKGPFPKRFTITLRHMDWRISGIHLGLNSEPRPYFCLEHMLRNEHWENVFGGLKVLRMELEVGEERKEHLVPLVKRLREYIFDIGKGEVLVAEEHVQESTWEGVQREPSMEPEWVDATFYVVAIVWRVRKMPL